VIIWRRGRHCAGIEEEEEREEVNKNKGELKLWTYKFGRKWNNKQNHFHRIPPTPTPCTRTSSTQDNLKLRKIQRNIPIGKFMKGRKQEGSKTVREALKIAIKTAGRNNLALQLLCVTLRR
jgi:hypothetical protein